MTTTRFTNAFFISDIHLTEDRPDCIRAFFQFLKWLPDTTDALFILGDFFEYWVGDDLPSELADDVALALKEMRDNKDVQLFFIAGNRDFSLGSDYCRRCNMTLLPETAMFTIANQLIHLSHGDELCTDDVSYQRFRRIIRHPWVMKLLLRLPKRQRVKIAERLRQRSLARFQANPVYIDVNPIAVSDLALQSEADLIVHGHTHIADIHQVNERSQRMVLGDWHRYGWYGQVDQNGARLHRFLIERPQFDSE